MKTKSDSTADRRKRPVAMQSRLRNRVTWKEMFSLLVNRELIRFLLPTLE